jgi:hypothetical protein
MSADESRDVAKSSSSVIVWVVVAVLGLLIIGGIIYFRKSRPETGGTNTETLANAIRPGSVEWNQYHSAVVLDKPEADQAKRALGDWVMTLHSTVRNFTGKTLNGLEVHAAVVDLAGKPVKERTVVIIPNRQPELEPNKTLPISVTLEGMKDSDVRADIKMEVTGFRFK